MALHTCQSRRLTAEEAVDPTQPTRVSNPAGLKPLAETWTPVRGEYECAAGSRQQAMASTYGGPSGDEDSAHRI